VEASRAVSEGELGLLRAQTETGARRQRNSTVSALNGKVRSKGKTSRLRGIEIGGGGGNKKEGLMGKWKTNRLQFQ